MLDFLWSGVSKSAPQVPQPSAEEVLPVESKQSAEGSFHTDPPPQSNPDADCEQPQVAENSLADLSQPAAAGISQSSTPTGGAETDTDALPAGRGDADTRATLPKDAAVELRRYQQRPRPGRRLVKKDPSTTQPLTPHQRLLLLDTWRRSGLPAGDFAALVGISKHTLYAWKKKFERQGPAGLMDQPRGGPAGSKLPDLTKRTILLLKQSNPTWGCQRISDMLLRGVPPCRPVRRRWRGCCTRPAMSSKRSLPGRTPITSAPSNGPNRISSGRLICSRLS